MSDLLNEINFVDDESVKWYFQDTLSPILTAYDKTKNRILEKQKEFTNAFYQAIAQRPQIEFYDSKLMYDNGRTLLEDIWDGNYTPDGVVNFSFIPKLDESELNTAIAIVQGKIDTGIDWFKLDNDSFLQLIKDANEKVDFSYSPSKWIEDNKVEDVISKIDTVKSAISTLDEGESLDFSFFKDFPEFAQYSNDSKKLREELEKIPKLKTAPLLTQLSQMLTRATSEKDKESIRGWI